MRPRPPSGTSLTVCLLSPARSQSKSLHMPAARRKRTRFLELPDSSVEQGAPPSLVAIGDTPNPPTILRLFLITTSLPTEYCELERVSHFSRASSVCPNLLVHQAAIPLRFPSVSAKLECGSKSESFGTPIISFIYM